MKSRPWSYSVVGHEAGFVEARIQLYLRWFDLNLVVIDRVAIGKREPSVQREI